MSPKKNKVTEELPFPESTATEEPTTIEVPTVITMQDHLEWITVVMDPMNHITNWEVEVREKFKIAELTNKERDLIVWPKFIATVTMIDWDWRPHFDIMFNPEIVYGVDRLPVPETDPEYLNDPSIQKEMIDDENPRPDWSYWVLIDEEHVHTHTTDSSTPTGEQSSSGHTHNADGTCCQQDPNTPVQTTPPVIKTPRSEIRNKL